MPDTPDAVRLRLRDALVEVYPGADFIDVDALLDQMADRGLTVADLAVHVCPPCPHIQTSDEGTSYCDLAEQAHDDCVPAGTSYVRRVERDAALAEVTRLREALDEAVQCLHQFDGMHSGLGQCRVCAFLVALAVHSEHLPTGGAE